MNKEINIILLYDWLTAKDMYKKKNVASYLLTLEQHKLNGWSTECSTNHKYQMSELLSSLSAYESKVNVAQSK